jgi:hypothetical protein
MKSKAKAQYIFSKWRPVVAFSVDFFALIVCGFAIKDSDKFLSTCLRWRVYPIHTSAVEAKIIVESKFGKYPEVQDMHSEPDFDQLVKQRVESG